MRVEPSVSIGSFYLLLHKFILDWITCKVNYIIKMTILIMRPTSS